ncbi:DUF4351 domain-containing protein [Laspinema sp. D1]|uniref:hypothetical protein n=1 Tax=Laspinema palackyanum TaxID=3231601 RepID=UPI0034857454|nr:DUF4351 domain-containing protein [Laspinema sp. D2b]
MPILSNIGRRAMEAARQQGRQFARREIVLEVLNDRFNPVPPAVTERINQISDLATLKQLCKRGISIGSLAEFEEVLESMLTPH